MEHQSILSIPLDAEKAALNSVAAEAGVTNISFAADEVQKKHGAIHPTATNGGDEARVVTLAEWSQASAALAEAFKEDATCLYFTHTPDRADWTEEQKWELHVRIMGYITYAHLLKGLVVTAGPNYDCVALWMPPGQNMDDYLTILRSGMWRLSYQLSREGRKRFFDEFLPLLTDTKAQIMGARDSDSWYLVYIGTRPSGRGKGYARKAIEYVTRMADDEGRACYLESSHHVNRKIYGKMGFEAKKCIYLQREREHVEMDIMVREPLERDSDADSGVDVQ